MISHKLSQDRLSSGYGLCGEFCLSAMSSSCVSFNSKVTLLNCPYDQSDLSSFLSKLFVQGHAVMS